jgi:hypothetical protein
MRQAQGPTPRRRHPDATKKPEFGLSIDKGAQPTNAGEIFMRIVNRTFGRAIVPAAIALTLAAAAQAATPQARLEETWRETMRRLPTPGEGCFKAEYPLTDWVRTGCVVAPDTPYIPSTGRGAFTVGDGNDYAAVVTGLISNGVGSFPSVSVKTEKDGGQANSYSLQMNSQFFASPACSGASNPANCLGWQQFVYSSSGVGFMQYWLIDYGNKCPSGGWMSYSTDCYKNSSGVNIPKEPITALAELTITGAAVSGGLDTFKMTVGTKAYSTTGNDDVVTLAQYWNAAEYNVIGDGGGSEAVFGKNTSITVNIALTDGLTAAPVCKADDGTTGETNNLTLGACETAGGTTPSVSFTESN